MNISLTRSPDDLPDPWLWLHDTVGHWDSAVADGSFQQQLQALALAHNVPELAAATPGTLSVVNAQVSETTIDNSPQGGDGSDSSGGHKQQKLSTSMIGGLVAGTVVLLLIMCGVVIYVERCRPRSASQEANNTSSSTADVQEEGMWSRGGMVYYIYSHASDGLFHGENQMRKEHIKQPQAQFQSETQA